MASSRHQSYYMVRLQGGIWDPRRKLKSLAKAMEVAFLMAEKHNTRAHVIQTVASVEIIDGKAVWTDRTPVK